MEPPKRLDGVVRGGMDVCCISVVSHQAHRLKTPDQPRSGHTCMARANEQPTEARQTIKRTGSRWELGWRGQGEAACGRRRHERLLRGTERNRRGRNQGGKRETKKAAGRKRRREAGKNNRKNEARKRETLVSAGRARTRAQTDVPSTQASGARKRGGGRGDKRTRAARVGGSEGKVKKDRPRVLWNRRLSVAVCGRMRPCA